ncbi:MAG: isopeptide-forming domain-containing fimbrial protein, partial [Acidobacteriota bacterium]
MRVHSPTGRSFALISDTVTLRSTVGALALCLLPFADPGSAQLCAVPGKDGGSVAPVVLTGVINTYYPSAASVGAGDQLIPVGLPSPGGAPAVGLGDLLLVLQVQGARIDSSNSTSYGDGAGGLTGRGFLPGTRTAGQHEFVVATGPLQTTGCPGGAARCLPVDGAGPGSGLVSSYSHRNTPSWDRYQVIRVPQYLSARVTSGLTALAWNGAVGGVLAVDIASTVDLDGAVVSLDGLGFRGGAGRSLGGGTPGFSNVDYVRASSVLYHASKGEGIAGTPRHVYDGAATVNLGFDPYPGGGFSRGAPATAGGGGNDWVSSNGHNSGGGAGANGGDGGDGG